MTKIAYTLITGASEGFGKALAIECAKRGMNLILVSLPGVELHRLGEYIINEFGTNVICREHDLSNKEECICLHREITRLDLKVNILINNAGIGGTHFFYERDADHYHRQIELNVVAPTLLTHLFLQDLEKNGPSHILNVSSLAGFFNLPTKQVYGGTKSYLLSFSKSLNSELKRKKIYVSTICPGGMNTNLSQQIQNSNLSGVGRWSVMDPEDVAKLAIDGMLHKKAVIIPGFWNRYFLILNNIFPEWLKEKIIDNKYYEPQNTTQMKQLSYWARNNKWKARLLIILSWIALTFLGIYIGTNLSNWGIQLPRVMLGIVITSFLLTVFLYPLQKQKGQKGNGPAYYRQKTFDLVLAVCSFSMVIYVSNNPDVLFQQSENLYAASSIPSSLPKDSSARSYKSNAEFSASLKDENGNPLKWKERKKLLKKQVKGIKSSRDLSGGEKFLLTFLACLAAAGLLYLVGALSCSLSCAGSEAAAIIVGIGGLGLVIFLLVITIRSIHGKNKRKAKKQVDTMFQPASQ
jgi:short-subunit dehydrogenase